MNSVQVEFGFTGLLEVLDSLREGIQILDHDFRYVYVNAAVSAHGQLGKSELLGRTMQECYPGIESTETFAFLRNSMGGRTPAAKRNEFTFADGSKRVFELRVQPCSAGLVVLSIDVTEEDRLEAQLHQAQKMEALGRLAGGVAHDFNNLLAVVLGSADLARERAGDNRLVRHELESIVEAAQRAAHLTHQLLALSRGRAPRLESLDLNRSLTQIEPILKRLLGRNIRLDVAPAPGLDPIRLDPSHVDQVLLNLVVNAGDAMPQGGEVTIETSNVVLDSEASRTLGVEPGSYVELSVKDTGPGVSPEIQSRIFEPFFTTKADRGTGLGLSILYNIVRRAEGAVTLHSPPGKGATFRIHLPSAKAHEETPQEFR